MNNNFYSLSLSRTLSLSLSRTLSLSLALSLSLSLSLLVMKSFLGPLTAKKEKGWNARSEVTHLESERY